MSLNVYLTMPGQVKSEPVTRIFVRENGQNREITRAEWDAKFPGCEPVTVTNEDGQEVFSANITHNLNRMADEAGIYKHLWRPDEIGITKAHELIEPLRAGLSLMKSDRQRFEAFNAKNGWGLYENFVPWIEEYLAACEQYPDAEVRVSR